MIAPQKLSKSLAKNRFKIGLSMTELTVIGLIVPVCTIIEIDQMHSFLVTFVCLFSLMIKNLLFEPKFFTNSIERKSHLKWERVKVRIND